jgi:primosomal protein N''
LDWSAQRQRIMRDEVMAEAVRGVVITTTPSGGPQETLCLPIEYMHGWLFGVSANRVKPELREKIIRYQRECFRALWRAFQGDTPALVDEQATPVPSTSTSMTLAQIRGLGLAIAQMAEQQMMLEQRVNVVDDRLDRAAEVVRALNRRLSAVETRITPASYIGDDQAQEIATQVKALAELLTAQEGKKNHYQGVFAELYRRFGVSSYKLIRQDQYEAVLQFLEEWRRAVSQPD